MKQISVIIILSLCLSSCEGEKTRRIVRTPEGIDYTQYNSELKDMRQMPEQDESGNYNLCSANLKNADLMGEYEKLIASIFDSKTVFPKELPDDFNPEQIMEQGKKEILSCGVKEAHKQGYTGKGVSVAIIDGTILPNHVDYKDSLVYYYEADRLSGEETANMHGTAICSIMAGKHGVAPDADIYYIADDLNKFVDDNSILAEDIYRLIDYNHTLPEDNKIRIISISTGMESEDTEGYQEYINALSAAHQEGIFVLTTSVGENRGDLPDNSIQYMGLSKIHGKLGKESYKFAHWIKNTEDNARWYQTQLCVPMDDMTVASPTGNKDYVFYHANGLSWSTPFLAGVYALACQKNPDITFEEFYKVAMDTADNVENKDESNTYKISHLINVEKILESV